MSLLTCKDCHQLVSSEAYACPTCGRPMRDRSFLTPMGQVAVGGLALVACVAWPPLFVILLLVLMVRFIDRARRGSKLSALTAGGMLVGLTVGLMYLMPSYALIVFAVGVAAAVWLVGERLGAARSRA